MCFMLGMSMKQIIMQRSHAPAPISCRNAFMFTYSYRLDDSYIRKINSWRQIIRDVG